MHVCGTNIAAEAAGFFNQQNLRACPRGTDRRRDPSRTPTGDQDIESLDFHRHPPEGKINRTIMVKKESSL
jgi:hypothetical protein